MSLQNYADRVVNYLHDQGYTYAAPDARGGLFKGGILMDVGNGERVAFLLPADEKTMAAAERNLRGYLDEVYPGRKRELGERDHGDGVTAVKVTFLHPHPSEYVSSAGSGAG